MSGTWSGGCCPASPTSRSRNCAATSTHAGSHSPTAHRTEASRAPIARHPVQQETCTSGHSCDNLGPISVPHRRGSPMHQRRLFRAVLAAAAVMLVLASAAPSAAAASGATSTHYTGSLADGATWIADVPASWNGTIILYSHGFGPQTAQDAPDPTTQADLLGLGYALAGTSYSGSSWWGGGGGGGGGRGGGGGGGGGAGRAAAPAARRAPGGGRGAR